MEWIQLIIGIGMVALFIWLLGKNAHRRGGINAIFRIDTVIGVIAGIYLIVTAAHALLF
jgi:hypothetical protein